MKCPKCNLVTFDHLAQCPRCKASFARQRRLTRIRQRPDRPVVVPRPAAESRPAEAPEVAAPPRPIAPPAPTPPEPTPPEPAARAPEPPRVVATPEPEPRDTLPPPTTSDSRQNARAEPEPALRSFARPATDAVPEREDAPDPEPTVSRPPTADQHAADAQGLKERMVRAGQARRAREQIRTAEIDPILPDWYEPTLNDDDETETTVATRSSMKR